MGEAHKNTGRQRHIFKFDVRAFGKASKL